MKKVFQFFRQHRMETILFIIASALRLVAFVVLSYAAASYNILTPNQNKFTYPVIGVDSGGYIGAAHVLLMEHRFASPGAAEPQSYLMPGYPMLLALIFFLGGGVASMIVFQALLAGLSAVLIYRIGKEIAPKVGTLAAWISVFDPISIFYTATILTETVFIFLTLLAVYVFLRSFSGGGIRGMAFVGFLIGISVYVRPNAIVFPAVFIFALFVWKEVFSWRQALVRSAILGVTVFLVVFPWMLRNKIIFNTWDFTAVSTIQWYWYNVPLYYAHTHGITHNEALDVFRKRLYEINPYHSDDGTLRNAPYMRLVVFEFLREDPLGYAWFHVVKSVPFFVSDGLRDIARRMRVVGEQPNISNLVLEGDLRGVGMFFTENTRAAVLLVLGVFFWSLITAGFLVAIWFGRSLSVPQQRALYVGAGIVGITMLVAAGPNASARYRLSVSPFMFLAASYGFIYLREWLKYRRVIPHDAELLAQ